MDIKHCYMCKQDLPVESFGKNRFHKDGLQSRCKKCDCEYKAIKYKEDRANLIRKANEKKAAKVAWLQEYKQTLACGKCGDARWYVLDFHHRNEADKEFSIAEMSARGFGIKRIEEEIKKCDVLCANCHRELHHFQRNGQGASAVIQRLSEEQKNSVQLRACPLNETEGD